MEKIVQKAFRQKMSDFTMLEAKKSSLQNIEFSVVLAGQYTVADTCRATTWVCKTITYHLGKEGQNMRQPLNVDFIYFICCLQTKKEQILYTLCQQTTLNKTKAHKKQLSKHLGKKTKGKLSKLSEHIRLKLSELLQNLR